jgi:hypothetical protein
VRRESKSRQVNHYRFGDSRFSSINDDSQIKINDRAGYWLDEKRRAVLFISIVFNDLMTAIL